MGSNPFVVSWWPLALDDPALFHVSLQTASLDEELRAQRGFPISELLMVDSVSLIRRKIEDSSLAYQDETLNSVVTLAAIEVRPPLSSDFDLLLTLRPDSTARETFKLVAHILMGLNGWSASGEASMRLSAQARSRQGWYLGKARQSQDGDSLLILLGYL